MSEEQVKKIVGMLKDFKQERNRGEGIDYRCGAKGKIAHIITNDLNSAWFEILSEVMTAGRVYRIDKGSYEGEQRITSPVVVEIKYPQTRPLAPEVPDGVTPPTTNDKIEEYFIGYLTDPKAAPNEHYTYAQDLYWQIPWVIDHYKDAHGNAHCYMTVGRPETLYHYDLNVDYGEVISVIDRATDEEIAFYDKTNAWNRDPKNKPSSQCLRGIDTWIDESGLNFWVYFRSWDLLNGFSQNMGGIQLLKEMMAGEIGVNDGWLIASCKDLHVYDNVWIAALARLGKVV